MICFKQAALDIFPTIVANRRTMHKHPEISFQEKWTTDFIIKELMSYGIEVVPWGGETGVVGLLKGGKPGPCVALRADIDALPMEEKNDFEFASEHAGCMHACGHDGHTAALLGAAQILAKVRDQLPGSVKFIFQPAEELLTGAAVMVDKGVLKNPDVGFIFGMHNTPEFETGTFLLQEGPFMASVAATTLTVKGQGGHGALPHLAKDPVMAAAGILNALQTIVSRQVSPLDPAVITFGSIHGGTVGNIIPDNVELKGTVRVFSEKLFDEMEEKMRKVINATAEAYQATAEFTYTKVVPSVINEPEPVAFVRSSAEKIFGTEHITTTAPSMGGEDFARFQEKVPGVFCWFGSGSQAKGIAASWHNPKFTIDEDALPLAAAMHAQVAYDWLKANA